MEDTFDWAGAGAAVPAVEPVDALLDEFVPLDEELLGVAEVPPVPFAGAEDEVLGFALVPPLAGAEELEVVELEVEAFEFEPLLGAGDDEPADVEALLAGAPDDELVELAPLLDVEDDELPDDVVPARLEGDPNRAGGV